jgi:hypothetical protein
MQTERAMAGSSELDLMEAGKLTGTLDRRVSRRGFLRGLGRGLIAAAALGAALPASRALASHDDEEPRGNRDSRERPGYAGLERLRALALGGCQLTSLPGADWITYVHPWGDPVFNFPPSWAVQEIVTHPPDGSSYGGAWVTAPDRTGQMLASTLITYDDVVARDAAFSALQELSGGADGSLIYDDHLERSDASAAFAAAEFGEVIVAIYASSALNPMANGSVVRYYVAVGHADAFDALTEQVFEPFFNQFLCGGDPTPSPDENPDEDDDEDDDEGPDEDDDEDGDEG